MGMYVPVHIEDRGGLMDAGVHVSGREGGMGQAWPLTVAPLSGAGVARDGGWSWELRLVLGADSCTHGGCGVWWWWCKCTVWPSSCRVALLHCQADRGHVVQTHRGALQAGRQHHLDGFVGGGGGWWSRQASGKACSGMADVLSIGRTLGVCLCERWDGELHGRQRRQHAGGWWQAAWAVDGACEGCKVENHMPMGWRQQLGHAEWIHLCVLITAAEIAQCVSALLAFPLKCLWPLLPE